MKWLHKLEYKHGRKYIRNLMKTIVFGMAIVFVAEMATPDINITSYLVLTRSAIAQWQLWRFLTFIFVPPNWNPFWLLFSLYIYYMIGSSLENTWGGFRFNLYYLFGMLGAIAAGMIMGVATNSFLNLSLILAYATLVPDATFLLMFIIPIKAKWMLAFYVAVAALNTINAFAVSVYTGLTYLVTLGFSLLGYLIFFGPTLVRQIKNDIRMSRNRRNWRNKNR